jgi:hypothetical protein
LSRSPSYDAESESLKRQTWKNGETYVDAGVDTKRTTIVSPEGHCIGLTHKKLCVDQDTAMCPQWGDHCAGEEVRSYVRNNCPKTCGFCDPEVDMTEKYVRERSER